MKIDEHIAVLKQKDGENIGFSESERQGTTTSANLEDNGDVSFSLKGKSPQGEQDTLTVCKMLINVLNKNGGKWREPEPGVDFVDCVSYDSEDFNKKIEIQVIRASTRQDLWKNLSATGKIERQGIPINDLVLDIKTSIDKKASDRKIPISYRYSITLALDATRLPSHTLDRVVNQFRNDYSEYSKSLGFDSIWIVGPTESLTSRLDIDPQDNKNGHDMPY
jgi:hypothetical protein